MSALELSQSDEETKSTSALFSGVAAALLLKDFFELLFLQSIFQGSCLPQRPLEESFSQQEGKAPIGCQ